jgi:DNA polymerase-3 subunit delta
MVAENADRAKERVLTQAVTMHGVTVHFYHPFESEIPRLISTIVKEAGYDIDPAASACLKEILGGNIALIEAELNKVFQFAGNRKNITLEDINESVGDFGLPLVFDLIDAIADKKRGKALEILARLLRDGEQPLMLLGMMAGHWRRLLAAREQLTNGDGPEKIAKDFKLNFNNKKAFLGQVSSLAEKELEGAFHLFYKADKALKSSSVAPRLVFENLLLELTAGERA